jgi:hypothetical protein
MTWFAVIGPKSGELLTHRGQLLIHDDRAELEFLIPNQRVVPVGGRTPEEVSSRYDRPVLRWRDHPDMAAVRWPLQRRDFL